MILPSCREVSRLVASGDFKKASFIYKLRLQGHLAICAHCRRFKRQMEMISRAFRELVFFEVPSERAAALERSVLAILRKTDS